MTYRVVVDGSMFARKGVFNDNLLANSINASSFNAYGDRYTNMFTVGNYTKTINFGSDTSVINYIGTNNVYGDVNVYGAFNFNGTFIYPNSFDFKTTTQNVSFCQNQGSGTTINLGNPNVETLNTNIYGNQTKLSLNNNNCIETYTQNNNAYIDFHSSNSTVDYDARITCTGGNSTTPGNGNLYVSSNNISIISNKLDIPNAIDVNSRNSVASLFTNQTANGAITIGSTLSNTTLQGAAITLPNNISSTTKSSPVGLFIDQSAGGNIILGTTNVNVSIRGSSLSIPNNVSSSNTNSLINLFTNQGTGGDIILGNSNVNVSIQGTRLSIPNNISSSSPTSVINLFTNQATGGDINIGNSNTNISLSGTLFLNGFVGQVAFFAMTNAPTGWFKCNGSAISRTQYSALFAVISTTYGSGDGSTTFNLPDFRGYFLRGLDDGKGIDSGRTLNNTAQVDDNKSHTHTATDSGHTHTATQAAHNHTISDPGHSHNLTFTGAGGTTNTPTKLVGVAHNGGSTFSLPGGSNFGSTFGSSLNNDSIDSGTTSITINNAQPNITVASSTANITVASSGGTETRPKNFALLICIKY